PFEHALVISSLPPCGGGWGVSEKHETNSLRPRPRRCMALHTPFHDATTAAGANFREDEGWLIPANFGDADEEYNRARSSAALFDISHHAKIDLTGPDATKFLHNLCTNDVIGIQSGHGREAFLTTSQAKIVALILIYVHESPHSGRI